LDNGKYNTWVILPLDENAKEAATTSSVQKPRMVAKLVMLVRLRTIRYQWSNASLVIMIAQCSVDLVWQVADTYTSRVTTET